MRKDLPETCFATLPSTGNLTILNRGETGYRRSDLEIGDKLYMPTNMMGQSATLSYGWIWCWANHLYLLPQNGRLVEIVL